MGFFGIGTWEILLILVLALIIWGPGRLPEIARTLGKITRTLKKASFDLTTVLTKEIEAEDKKNPPPPAKSAGEQTEPASSSAAKTEARQQDTPPRKPERQ